MHVPKRDKRLKEKMETILQEDRNIKGLEKITHCKANIYKQCYNK